MLVNKTAEPLAARAGATPNLRWAFMLVTSLFFDVGALLRPARCSQ